MCIQGTGRTQNRHMVASIALIAVMTVTSRTISNTIRNEQSWRRLSAKSKGCQLEALERVTLMGGRLG